MNAHPCPGLATRPRSRLKAILRASCHTRVVCCIGALVVFVKPLDVLAQLTIDAAAEPPVQAAPLEEVIVSARKRSERLVDVPAAVSSLSEQALRDFDIRDFADYASKIPGLSYAYGNGGIGGETGTAFSNARTIAIRGIAGARTTGYYLDDTPLPGAVDVRVVDIADIEVLRGPQGTLFDESSLGGNVRLISKAPDLAGNDYRYKVDFGSTQGSGSRNSGVEAVGNLVIKPDRAALRMAAFASRDGGFLTRSYRSDITDPAASRSAVDNQGASRNVGGSLTGLFSVTPDLDLTLRVIHQNQRYNGAPVAFAPLPSFEPVYELDHVANIQPEASDRWTLGVAALNYNSGNWSLSSSTSVFERRANDVEDSSAGTIQFINNRYAPAVTPDQGYRWTSSRAAEQVAHETRLAWNPEGIVSGIAGLHYSRLDTHRFTPPVLSQNFRGSSGATNLWVYDNRYRQEDRSLFGEIYLALSEHYTLTLGNRRFWLDQADQSSWDGALYGAFNSRSSGKGSGNNPRVALSYKPDADSLYYASATRGFRAGGAINDYSALGCLNPGNSRPDKVMSYELGIKQAFVDSRLMFAGAVYRLDWKDIQQLAFDQGCQFFIFGNAGTARVDGAELEITGALHDSLDLRASIGYSDARIVRQEGSQQLAGSRINHIPEWTANLGLVHERPLAAQMTGVVTIDYSYTGDSVSSTSLASGVQRPAYRLLQLRAALRWQQSELSLGASNLGNERPNLGDVGYLGYMRFAADGATPMPQVVTLPPRTWTLSYSRNY